MKLIALSGKRRSGKTTLGTLLNIHYGYKPVSLAGPLKDICCEHFGLTSNQTDGPLKEVVDTRYNKTPRQIMIETGQFYRSIDKNYWIKKLFKDIEGQDGVFVVTDVRFKNEMGFMKVAQALCVRLDRGESYTGPSINDPSETDLDDYKEWDIHVGASANKDMTDLSQIGDAINAHILARA